MTEYTREILSLYVKPEKDSLRNVVTRVTWRWTVRDEANFADLYRDTYFANTDPNNFLDYNDLTDQIVFGWIDSVENINDLGSQLDEKLNQSKNPVMIEKKIPWESPSVYTGEEEYLLVFDDEPNNVEKIWGPMRWNSKRANDGLRARGVHDYEFPTDIVVYQKQLLPIDGPIAVTQGVKLYKVEFSEQPVLDDRFQYHEGLTWVIDSGKAVGTYFVLDRSLAEVKSILQEQLSTKSFQRQVGGVEVDFNGYTVKLNTDVVARVTLIQRWQLMADTDTIKHKVNNQLWMDLTKSEVTTLLHAIHDHISSVLNWEHSIFNQIENAEGVSVLKEIEA
jgi:hypothetical protein